MLKLPKNTIRDYQYSTQQNETNIAQYQNINKHLTKKKIL